MKQKVVKNYKAYMKAKTIFYNTGKNEQVFIAKDDFGIALRDCLYKYQKRKGYSKLFRTRTIGNQIKIWRLI